MISLHRCSRSSSGALGFGLTLGLSLLAFAGAHAQQPQTKAQTPATLTGFVHDSSGAPIQDAEVILRGTQLGTRTDAQGEFKLANVPPGTHLVWFRRLGFASIEYTWVAEADQKTDLTVALPRIPRMLDPVVVRAEEDRRAKAHASIVGSIIDDNGAPIPDVEVQIVGANISGMTRENGGFLFRSLGVGPYVVRARKIGYSPNTQPVQLVENDDREVVITLRRLPAELSPVTVLARSGYGNAELPWKEFEQRKRWKIARARVLGPEDLKSYYSRGLDDVGVALGVTRPRPVTPTSIPEPGKNPTIWHNFNIPDEACVLVNGKDPRRVTLSSFSAKDVALLEVYPGGTYSSDFTNTISPYFRDPQCRAKGPPDATPTYWVVWLKD